MATMDGDKQSLSPLSIASDELSSLVADRIFSLRPAARPPLATKHDPDGKFHRWALWRARRARKRVKFARQPLATGFDRVGSASEFGSKAARYSQPLPVSSDLRDPR